MTNSSSSWLSTSTSVADADDVEPAHAASTLTQRGSTPAIVTGTPSPSWTCSSQQAQPAPDRRDPAVERRALLERAVERVDDGVEVGVVHLLAVLGAHGPRDVLVHEGAAEVVASTTQASRAPSIPHFGGTLMDENISRAAGAEHGQEMDDADFHAIVDPLHRPLEQRTTLYGRVATIGRRLHTRDEHVHDGEGVPVTIAGIWRAPLRERGGGVSRSTSSASATRSSTC